MAKALSPLPSPGRPAVEEEIMGAKTQPSWGLILGSAYCIVYVSLWYALTTEINDKKLSLVETHIVLQP